jgi:hypothetical protein
MILSADALDILAYLKTAPGKFVSMPEISRRAGGRRRFEESPGWARHLVSLLLEAGLVEVNARGHYRVPPSTQPQPHEPVKPTPPASRKSRVKIVGDDYFPVTNRPIIVDGDYFPPTD